MVIDGEGRLVVAGVGGILIGGVGRTVIEGRRLGMGECEVTSQRTRSRPLL